MGKPEEKRPLGSLRHRWENTFKIVFRYNFSGMKWIDLDQDKDKWRGLVNSGINFRFP
jgi:hypothetical protein